MFTPGNDFGKGRPKGSTNKSSNAIREAYQKLLENNLDNMSVWLGDISKKDPAKAVDLMLRLSEYILPKLARTEVTGSDGEDLFANVKFVFNMAESEDPSETPQNPENTNTDI